MIREGKNLFAYSNEKNLGLTLKECENVRRTKLFEEVLRTRRNLYYKEVANDPSLSRATVKGLIVLSIQKLIEKELYEKAITGAMSLAKLEGWTSDAANVNVFNELSQKDLDAMRAKFTKIVERPAVSKDN